MSLTLRALCEAVALEVSENADLAEGAKTLIDGMGISEQPSTDHTSDERKNTSFSGSFPWWWLLSKRHDHLVYGLGLLVHLGWHFGMGQLN